MLLAHLFLRLVLLDSLDVFLVEDLSQEGRIALLVELNLLAEAFLLTLQDVVDELRVPEILNELLVFALGMLALPDD